MKKFLLVLLALVLCLGMVACGDKKKDKDANSSSASESGSFTGKYTIVSLREGNEYLDITKHDLDKSYLQINADGSFYLDFDGTETGTYNATKRILQSNSSTEPYPYTVDGNKIIVLIDGELYVTFQK